MSKYSKKVKKKQNIQLVLIAVLVLALAVWVYAITRPTVTEYTIRDECGPIGGAFSHTIDDADACVNACSAYCQSLELEYYDSEFSLAEGETCNSCACECKE